MHKPRLDPEALERAMVDVIRCHANRQGITQAQLAELVGISQSQMSRMFAGRKPVTVSELARMCSALGVGFAQVTREATRSLR